MKRDRSGSAAPDRRWTAAAVEVSRRTAGTLRRITAAILVVIPALLGGCAGSGPSPEILRAAFDRHERDTRALAPAGAAAQVLSDARASHAGAGSGGQERVALQAALADVRAALALAEMERAETQADACRRDFDASRRSWDEALKTLLRTEQAARRTAEAVPHQVPALEAPLDRWPPTTLDEAALPPATLTALRQAWTDWSVAARELKVPTADLEGRFDEAVTAAAATKKETQAAHVRAAGRIVQELEARVRRASAQETCARASTAMARTSEARDAALRGTLELERGLQDALRAQIEQTRAEAQTRQEQLFGALQQLEGKFARISQDARGTIVSLADILFDFNQATLKRDVEFSLVRVATILNQFPEMRIRVEGHTDNVGRPEYNLELSQRRAQAVHDFLASQGVDAARMTVEGFGLTRPVADNETPEGRQRNRRVDLVIED